MRIIAGQFKRRRLATPVGQGAARPMPDFVREALFSLLRGHTEGQAVVDAFAGTGAVGLEAISRGADRCVFIERDKRMARLLRDNIATLGVEDRATVVEADAMGGLALARCPRPVHLVFFDPPYRLMNDALVRPRVFAALARFIELLDDEGYAVLRTPWPFLEQPAEDSATAATGPETAPPSQAPARAKPRAIDLTIAGADGPETHAYGSTAVHLYMKQRS